VTETEVRPFTASRAAMVVAVASVCFAWSGPLARLAAPTHPLVIAAGRTGLAAMFLFLVAPRTTIRAVVTAPPRVLAGVALAGALLAAHFGLFLAGLAATSLPAAVTLVSLEPIAVVLTAWAVFGSRPSRGEAIGVTLATLGAVVLSQGAGGGGHRIFGDVLVLLAVALYGAYLAVARGLAGKMPPAAYASLVYAVSTPLLAITAAALGASFTVGTMPSVYILLLALIPTLGGHTLVQWAAGRVPSAVVALVSPGETVGSLAIAALLLGETPSPLEASGAALALAGVGFTIAAQRKKP
jgi:drug/metabolite transporter (DMT)-like permease